jgi:iron(III) transport system permease protein
MAMRRTAAVTDSFTLVGGAMVAVMSLAILALVVTILVLSVTPQPASGVVGATIANYVQILRDPQTLTVLGNSTVFALVALAVALGFGLPLAWLTECTDMKGKGAVTAVMLTALLLPTFAAAAGWLFLLHPRIGVLNVWLAAAFGTQRGPFNILSLGGMGWVEGLSRAPIAFLMTGAAFRAMDHSLEEAALTAGAPALAVLWRIVMPLMSPALLSCAIYILMIGFGSFDVPAIIGWGDRTFTFGTYIYLLTNPQDVFPGYGTPAALGSLMLAVALGLIWWARRLMNNAHRYAVVGGKAYRPRLLPLGRAGQAAAWGLSGAFLLFSLLLPLLVLVWSSLLPFLQVPSDRSLRLVSLTNYRNLPWDLLLSGLKHTAFLAVVTPPIVLVVSFCFSWLGFRTRLPGRRFLDQVAFAPQAIPHIVLAMGLLLTALYVVQPVVPIYGTVAELLFAFTIAWLSYATRVTNFGLLQLHKELEESARVSGASTWSIVGRVVLPLLSRALLLAGVYVATLTARELTLSVLLSTPGNMTLPVVIWSLWLNGGLGRASAALVCFLLCMLPLMALYVALSWNRTDGAPASGRRRAAAVPAATPALGSA